jgi:pyruvate/2-oxoglutarate dehydrogenase complex dihydrolipoamide dehydrogenase (E3) component
MHFDLIVLGNDDAAFETAIQAARSGLRVLSVMPRQRHSATLLARSLQRTTLELAADFPVQCRSRFRDAASPTLLQRLITRSIHAEIADQLAALRNAGVQTLRGEPSFLAAGWIRVDRGPGQPDAVLKADCTVVGVGVRRTLLSIALAKYGVHGPQYLLQMPALPESVIVAGGDDFGTALAAFSSAVGIHTELLTRPADNSSLLELALETGVKLVDQPDSRLLADVFTRPSGTAFETLPPILDCRRAVGFTGHLRLDTLGIQTDENGLLWCSSSLESWCPGVFGAGEVVGFSPENFSDTAQQAARILEVACQKRLHSTHSRSRRQLIATT